MSKPLDKLAEAVGIEREYHTIAGGIERVPDEATRAALSAMGIAAADDTEIAARLAEITPADLGTMQAPEGVACYMPDWLRDGRTWGVACQLYGLRSARNWGIGDFADLGRFAEIAAAAGADFVGVNPLHALFLAAPDRFSPFSPSNRDFLNPLYIAIDRVPGYDRLREALQPPPGLDASEFVDYARVGPLKVSALERLFSVFQMADDATATQDFERFCAERGAPLFRHALFESLSEAMVAKGHGATWHGWPEEFRRVDTPEVSAFAAEHAERIAFHSWLQWTAARQLRQAQQRALAAGMRIGLYLDLAVGVSPDGSSTWSDPQLVVPGARIGAPPDYFNADGQDWGLAPLSPAALVERDFVPYREAMDIVVQSAGALRIDHAMSLYRLFWIGDRFTAASGAYVRYPFPQMLRTLAEVSQERQVIVIGEDLGVVPSGFRDVMQKMEIQSYRVLFFEKREDDFLPMEAYPKEALACITTHDLHTLAGWWTGHDLEVRRAIGMIKAEDWPAQLEERAHERRGLLGMLSDAGLLPPELQPVMRGEADPGQSIPEALAVSLHRLVARTPSRLLAVAAEDLVGTVEQVNIPGTTDAHPNWRRRLPVPLEALPETKLFRAVTGALREERPRAA